MLAFRFDCPVVVLSNKIKEVLNDLFGALGEMMGGFISAVVIRGVSLKILEVM